MTKPSVTWADLAQLKKTAKAIKADHPGLSHVQRLDMLAAAKYGVRHFHELQKRYEAYVDSHIDKDGRAYHCRFCAYTFDGGLPEDIKAHGERHQHFEDALSTLGYLPEQYRERERTKRLGYDWMYSPHAHIQRHGALTVLLTHFERSLEHAIGNGYWPRHPYFDEYVACALPGANFIPAAVRQSLIEEFGERPGIIPPGHSDWPSQAIKKSRASPESVTHGDLIRQTVRQAVIAANTTRKEA